MADTIDNKAFHQFSYGLFLLTSQVGGRDNGCIINTAIQSASEPRQISLSCVKGSCTQEMIDEAGVFCVSVLTEGTPNAFFKHFGMQSGHDVDKFEESACAQILGGEIARCESGLVYEKTANAFFSCKVTVREDLGSHVMYNAEVVEAKRLSDEPSITYDYYRRVTKKQDAPAEGKPKGAIVAWKCTVCGYIYEGEQPPEACPVCKAPASAFKKVEGELKLAAEHEFGIYAKTVKDNPDISDEDKAYIFEQLKANFTGECSEVGMYLCMARIAHREGYPEVGLYWEKAAYEEAEHAAKFAELLGEDLEPNMKADTKANLAWRVDCEFGATQGKTDLALCAKKNGLDAIHDTVHEMARDEARHGKALKGLLERYFG